MKYHPPPAADGLRASIGAAQTINDTNPAFQQPADEPTSFVGGYDQTVPPVKNVQFVESGSDGGTPTEPQPAQSAVVTHEEIHHQIRSIGKIIKKSPHFTAKRVFERSTRKHEILTEIESILTIAEEHHDRKVNPEQPYYLALRLKAEHEGYVYLPTQLGALWGHVQQHHPDLDAMIDEWAKAESVEVIRYNEEKLEALKVKADINEVSTHLRPVLKAIADKTHGAEAVYSGRVTVGLTKDCDMGDWDAKTAAPRCGITDVGIFNSKNRWLGDNAQIAWVANLPAKIGEKLTTANITAWCIRSLLAAKGNARSAHGNSVFALTNDGLLFWVSMQPALVGTGTKKHLVAALDILDSVGEDDLGATVDVVDRMLNEFGTVSVHRYDSSEEWKHSDINANDDKIEKNRALTGFFLLADLYKEIVAKNPEYESAQIIERFEQQLDDAAEKNPPKQGRKWGKKTNAALGVAALTAIAAILHYKEVDILGALHAAGTAAWEGIKNFNPFGGSGGPQLLLPPPMLSIGGPSGSSKVWAMPGTIHDQRKRMPDLWFEPQPIVDYTQGPPVEGVAGSSQFWY
ncbi:unnamed protein product [Ectocarpus sp. 6 AP-2014]